jgi:serine/threonine-protein kinase SRPK3
MNGTDMKKAAINKAKQVAHAANSNGGKKRRKGQDLKPIITTENQGNQNTSPAGSSGSFQYKYVHQHQHQHQHHLLPTACTHHLCRPPNLRAPSSFILMRAHTCHD